MWYVLHNGNLYVLRLYHGVKRYKLSGRLEWRIGVSSNNFFENFQVAGSSPPNPE